MNSPSRPREEPEEPGAETAVPGDFQRTQELPRSIRNKRADETDSPGRDRAPGGHRGEQEASNVVKGDPDRAKVVHSAGYDGTHPRSGRSERIVETNAQCRNNRPGVLESNGIRI